LTLERKAPGYLGTTIIIPGGNKSPLRYIIRRFAGKAAMEGWDNSEESLRLLKEANDYSTRDIHWFGNMVYAARFENS
jgi:antibiotic biosynthesis monooxygenase (ABM) superfamily enzyme